MPSRSVRAAGRLTLAVLAVPTLGLSARQEPLDRAMVDRIGREGTDHSKVSDAFGQLVRRTGPPLTGSPAHEWAADWAARPC